MKKKGDSIKLTSMAGRRKNKEKKRRSPWVNRNGIPVFDRGQDLSRLFEAARSSPSDADSEDGVSGKGPSSASAELSQHRDRHGIPILGRRRRVAEYFDASGGAERGKTGMPQDPPEDPEEFARLLEASLEGKSRDLLLREKRDRSPAVPVPLKKRLKRYPPPQNQLDLHGFTSAQAESAVAHFLRRSRRNGFFTVRIIVGRGLHSESGAVLPDVVTDLLARLKAEEVVLWHEWDRSPRSRSGAVIVYLKQFQ